MNLYIEWISDKTDLKKGRNMLLYQILASIAHCKI